MFFENLTRGKWKILLWRYVPLLANSTKGGWGTPEILDRYVDYVLAIIKTEQTGTILEKLNRTHRNIEFTMKIEKEGEIPDLKIIRKRRLWIRHLHWFLTQKQRTITYTSNDDYLAFTNWNVKSFFLSLSLRPFWNVTQIYQVTSKIKKLFSNCLNFALNFDFRWIVHATRIFVWIMINTRFSVSGSSDI